MIPSTHPAKKIDQLDNNPQLLGEGVRVAKWKFTCYNDDCTGTRNIQAIGFRNKLKTVRCVIIIQSHLYLIFKVYHYIFFFLKWKKFLT